ncbi:hypothetical protein J7E38_00040 [Bacillus sp. ISL-35]|uniref:hypothetical protein n=1 Tax=Bacillus sp. ISL-35 TaxID=2819122 RepID=UPI001BEA5EFB|nr:hypothetical protein [Bacillus sp. ISL-35]MBT2677364.1 hypothetical protein [Bacillus sp. ISL-35]MBT2702249.1 hypothetical protein [Chryseobacterium sp. ISL-80]
MLKMVSGFLDIYVKMIAEYFNKTLPKNAIFQYNEYKNNKKEIKTLRKLVGILVSLVIVLVGVITFGYFKYENRQVVNPEGQSLETNRDGYQFRDIESMDKAKTVGDAIDIFFGDERLVITDSNKEMYEQYYQEELATSLVLVPFYMIPASDSRKEMIDFLHFIQHSELFENQRGDPYQIQMNVNQPIKPGMNLPSPHQKWIVSTENLKLMDFSDKETMVWEIQQYGHFEGYNPSQ